MADGRIQARLREEIKRELSSIVEFEARDPVIRDAFPTVMDVKLSADVHYARVYVAVDSSVDRDAVLAAFRHDRGFFRTELAKRLPLRYTPQLEFILDDTMEWAMRINRLLKDEDNAILSN